MAHPGILVTTKSGKSGKVLQGSYDGVRVYNFFINKVLEQIENGTLSETDEVKNYLGEAYYLYPIGVTDMRTASPDRSLENTNLYQNINWPTSAGGHAEK